MRRSENEMDLTTCDYSNQKAVNKKVLAILSNNVDQISYNAKVPFLNMVNAWADSKLESFYLAVQEIHM